jgi:hypothetical protein
LGILGVDASKLGSLTVCELIHGCLGEVEAISSVIHSQDVNSLALVGDSIASTALQICQSPVLILEVGIRHT